MASEIAVVVVVGKILPVWLCMSSCAGIAALGGSDVGGGGSTAPCHTHVQRPIAYCERDGQLHPVCQSGPSQKLSRWCVDGCV